MIERIVGIHFPALRKSKERRLALAAGQSWFVFISNVTASTVALKGHSNKSHGK